MKQIKRTDKGRLDCLQKLLFGANVVCRDSTVDRGWRLHQTEYPDGSPYNNGMKPVKSVRKAIDNFLDAELKKPKSDEPCPKCGRPKTLSRYRNSLNFCPLTDGENCKQVQVGQNKLSGRQ